MPDIKRPIMLDEVTVTAQRTPSKKYREVKEKVKLYPNKTVDKYQIDSLINKGHGNVIGGAIKIKGQPDMYGADASDKITQLIRRKK